MSKPRIFAALSLAADLIHLALRAVGLALSPAPIIRRLRGLDPCGAMRDPALWQPLRNDQLNGPGVARSSHRTIPSLARRTLVSSPANGASLSHHLVRDSTGEAVIGHAAWRTQPLPRRGSSRCRRRCGHRKESLPRTGMGRGLSRPQASLRKSRRIERCRQRQQSGSR